MKPDRTAQRNLSAAKTNVTRRLKYAADITYRQKARERANRYYRNMEREVDTAYQKKLATLANSLKQYAKPYHYVSGKKQVKTYGVPSSLLSQLCDRSESAIEGWVSRRILPPPDLEAYDATNHLRTVYSVYAAKRILLALAKTLRSCRAHLRDSDIIEMRRLLA